MLSRELGLRTDSIHSRVNELYRDRSVLCFAMLSRELGLRTDSIHSRVSELYLFRALPCLTKSD